jgi:hypothetical protein
MKWTICLFVVLAVMHFGQSLVNAQSEFLDASWREDQLQPVLAKTLRLHLDTPLDELSEGERTAVKKLLEAGQIFHELYLESRHREALSALITLEQLHEQKTDPGLTQSLLDLYRVMHGPIATTLDNKRVPFLPVAEEEDGKNVYPQGATKSVLDSILTTSPDRKEELLHLRSVVRRASRSNAERDLAILTEHNVLDVLHPGLRARLESVRDDPSSWRLYAVPYSVAYADRIFRAHDLLHQAADAVTPEDPAFARYLRLRARDLLTDDYEAGDAAWVTGQFDGNLNAEIGSYETYDDALFGVKSFFGLSLLLRDPQRSAELTAAIAGLQEIEDALPYDHHRRVRSNVPVGVYHVIADFGQTRGTNTATILPNESHLSRQYGRTILIRANILMNPKIFSNAQNSFRAATEPMHHDDLEPRGNLEFTLWHEIGHYLGVDRTADGRELDEGLQDTADVLEELKADLVSLFAASELKEQGQIDEARLRAVYARGIDRALLKNRPRRTQPYGIMQLIQWNWYLDRGVLSFQTKSGRLQIDYSRYRESVESLLREVLSLQHAGDRDAADAFIVRWTSWDENLHGVVGQNMKAAESYRYSLVTYGALGEKP